MSNVWAAAAPETARDPYRVALENALRTGGFDMLVDGKRPRRMPAFGQAVPIVLAVLAWTFGSFAANEHPFTLTTSTLLATAGFFVGTYFVVLARSWTVPILVLLFVGWVGTGLARIAVSGFDGAATSHGIPLVAGLVAVFVAVFLRLLFTGARGALGSISLLFPVVLVVLFIPLFTQELWQIASVLGGWHMAILALVAILPVLLAVRQEVCASVPAAFETGADRLEVEKSVERVKKELQRVSGPALARDAFASEVIGRVPGAQRLPGIVDLLSGPDEWDESLKRSFTAPAPRAHAPSVADALQKSFTRQATWRLFPFVLGMGLLIALYMYVLAAVAIDVEDARRWSRSTIHTHDVFGLSLPTGAYIWVAGLLGVVATSVFLAFVLMEERYSSVIADALIHRPIERCLLLAVPYCYLRSPANDGFDSAEKITGPTGRATGTNVGATKEPDEPSHAGNAGGRSVWYAWEAPAPGAVTIDTTGSSFDTLLAVYTGSDVSHLTRVASHAGIGVRTPTSGAAFEATAGTVYRIAVDGYRSPYGHVAEGTVTLNWWSGPPENNKFADAHEITGVRGQLVGMNLNATKEPGEPRHADNDGGKSVWYVWEAPQDGPVTMDTSGSTFDTLLAVYSGSDVADLRPIASNDDDVLSQTSRVAFDADAGATYRIAVDGKGGPDGVADGWFALNWWTGVPLNDAFDSAAVLLGCSGQVGATNVHATREEGEPPHAENGGGKSVWYVWEAPVSGEVTLDTAGSTFDTLLAVYTGDDLAELTQVASNDDVTTDIRWSQLTFPATRGTTYRIAVDGYRSSDDSVADGWITLSWQAPPPNDRFADPDLLVGAKGSYSGTNQRATKEDGEPKHAGNAGGKSVWYRWEAPATGPVVFDTHGSDFDTLLAVYTGTDVAQLTEVVSNDDAEIASGIRTSRVEFEATAGTVYLIAVDGYSFFGTAAEGSISLNWEQ